MLICTWDEYQAFQSTHPVRGATVRRMAACAALTQFQSTHPVRGATSGVGNTKMVLFDFNPRTP